MKEKNIRELAIRMGLITVEDMCQYTITQLVVKIANKVNELVNEVWRFETDVQEILKSQNENIQYLLGEGLHLEVENIFDGWLQDGTFDTLINQTALEKVNERIDETNAQLSEAKTELSSQLDTITQQLNEPYHYYVGVNQKYKTITEAFNEWLKHKQPSIIHILSGIYYEFVKYTGYCNCSFIGECKETTIVYSRSGKYEEAPLTVQGDLTIENLTLKVDSSENSDFTENTNPAYALHIDSPNVEGTTVVRNCDLISYVNAGLGCGTRQNQTIILEDTNIYNYRNIGDHRYKTGMLYHNSATNGHINQNIKMKNVKAYSKNGRALMIYSYNTDDTKAQFEAVNTKLLSDVYEGNDAYFYNKDTSDNVIITGLEINDGSSKEVSDCNLAPNGNFKCNGATGGLNMPFPRWGIGNTISFDKETFKIQTIYDITKNFECYQRTKNATVWSDWERIDSKYAKNSNDSNLCLSNGLYLTNVNTPTSDQFMIDCKFANSFYGIQEAYRLTDMKLWKRTYINKVFSEWVVV